MHGITIDPIVGRVKIILNPPLVIKIESVGPLDGVPTVRVTEPKCNDVLIGIWNRWGKGPVRHRTLVKLIAKSNGPIRRESPIPSQAKGKCVSPILVDCRVCPQDHGILPCIDLESSKIGELDPLHVGFEPKVVGDFNPVSEGNNGRKLDAGFEIALRTRTCAQSGGGDIVDGEGPVIFHFDG